MKHTINLTDSQEAALQSAFDLGTTSASDLDSYAAEWLGSLLDQYSFTIPLQKAESLKEAYLADPDVAVALDAAFAAIPPKAAPVDDIPSPAPISLP